MTETFYSNGQLQLPELFMKPLLKRMAPVVCPAIVHSPNNIPALRQCLLPAYPSPFILYRLRVRPTINHHNRRVLPHWIKALRLYDLPIK